MAQQSAISFLLSADDKASAVLRTVGASLAGVQSKVTALSTAFTRITSGAVVGTVFVKAATAAAEAEQASARLNAVLIATGHSAGVTKKEIDDLADSMAKSTQFDDEGIRNAASTFLKFGNIQKGVFKEGIKLAADYAAFTGSEISEAAQVIGKALQSPTEGIGALERQIGKLSFGQKENIKLLMEQGRLFDAQSVVLKVLQDRIGGVATALNTGLNKSLSDVSKNFNELLESIGKARGSAGSGFLDFINDSLKDMKAIVDSGDWVDRLLRVFAFAGGVRNLPPPLDSEERKNPTRSIGGTSGLITPEEGARRAAQQAIIDAAEEKAAALKKERDKKARAEAAKNAQDFLDIGARAALKKFELIEEAEEKATEAAVKEADERNKRLDERNVEFLNLRLDRMKEEAQAEQDFLDSLAQGSLKRAELGDAVNEEALKKVADEAKKAQEFVKDLGLTFTSAFEDAVIRGKKLREVMQGLLEDIARIILRKNVLEPLLGGIGSAFSGGGGITKLFGGSFASGTNYVPRDMLALVHKGEAIVPASQNKGGGGTFNFNFSGGSPTDSQAFLAAVVPVMRNIARGEIGNQLRDGGALKGA